MANPPIPTFEVPACREGLGRQKLGYLFGRDELALHLRASTATGVSDSELAQVLQHVGVYAGVPAANHALQLAKVERAR